MTALRLKTVAASRGLRWIGDALRLFARRPLGFTLMFGAFLFVSLLVGIVPLAGPLLQMAALPLLTLGFMIAGQSVLLGGPVQPLQFAQPLRGDRRVTREILKLCLLYAVAALAVYLLATAAAGPAWGELQALMAKGPVTQADAERLMADGGLAGGAVVALALGALVSVPFWHAPALVLWGGQGLGQSLFSSTLAVWRARGAFLAYGLGWMGVSLAFVLASALTAAVLGSSQLMGLLVVPAGLVMTAWFYLSVLFSFNDSFGLAQEGAGAVGEDPPPATAG